MRVPSYVITDPSENTVSKIDGEDNVEVRRVMIDRYGPGRYLQDSGAVEVDRGDRGVLYSKDISGDEPIVVVRVRNSTPEPDGSVKDYWLRVPPTVKTAAEAVAWTFGMEMQQYRPEKET